MPVDHTITENQWLRYVYLRDNGHLDYIVKANKCDDFFLGSQWNAVDKSLLDQQRRPALTINKVLATISNVLGDQIQSRADISFKPTHVEGEDISNVLDVLAKQTAATNKLDWKESEVFADGVITSRGFFDMRLSFKQSLQGEIEITVPNPRNVIIDADGEEYDPDTWKDLFVTKWLAPNDIEVLYNKDDADYLRSNFTNPYAADIDSVQHSFERFGGTGHYPSAYQQTDRDVIRNVRVLERQYKKITKMRFFVDTKTGDMRPIPDTWERNRVSSIASQYQLGVIERVVERIRWTVTAGNVVLHDDWSPYKHFTVVPYFPYFRRGRTMGLVENLLDPQELLNKVSSQELHIVNTTANSGYKVKAGALRNMTTEELETRGAQTGVVFELDDIDNLEKLQPNQIPTGIDRISYKAEEHIKTISNIDDNALGQDREDVAAKAIKAKRERGAVNQLKVLDNLNFTRWLLWRNVLDVWQEYFTEPRMYRITFENPVTQEAEDQDETESFISINQFDEAANQITNDLTVGTYDVVITSVPAKDTIEESEFEQAVALRQLGIAIPDDVIISHSLLREKRAIVRRMREASQTPEAQAQAQLTQQSLANQVALQAAEVDETKANAMLKAADAQSKVAEMMATNGPDGTGGKDMLSQVMQNHHDAQQGEEDRSLRREEMAHEKEMQAREHGHETVTNSLGSRREVASKQLDHAHQLEAAEVSAKNASEQEKAKSASAIKLAKTKVASKPKPKAAPKKR